MGFNLSAFGAGFATAAVKDIQEEQKLAELRGAEAVKIMQANYKTVNEENKKRESELVGNIDLLKAYDPTATEAELYAISTNKPVMDAITGYIKKDEFDPASFKVSNFAKVTENNVTATALERVKMLSTLPVIAKAAVTEQIAPSGNILKDLLSTSSAKAKEKAMLEYARATGIPLERLQAAQGFVRPKAEVAAEIDMSKLRPEKGFAAEKEALKLAAFKAAKDNDPVAAKAAETRMAVIKDIENNFTSEQTKFAERAIKLKNASLTGTPEEKKRADAELAKIWAFERKEAEAKKVRGDGEEGKVPAMSSLNSFTSSAVSRAIKARFGELITSDKLAVVPKIDGGVEITYTGTDIKTRQDILNLQAVAAQKALSMYIDPKGQPVNRDVATVLNSFTYPATITQTESAPEATSPATAPVLPKPVGLPPDGSTGAVQPMAANKPFIVDTKQGRYTFATKQEADTFTRQVAEAEKQTGTK